jgi:hypothetical protein
MQGQSGGNPWHLCRHARAGMDTHACIWRQEAGGTTGQGAHTHVECGGTTTCKNGRSGGSHAHQQAQTTQQHKRGKGGEHRRGTHDAQRGTGRREQGQKRVSERPNFAPMDLSKEIELGDDLGLVGKLRSTRKRWNSQNSHFAFFLRRPSMLGRGCILGQTWAWGGPRRHLSQTFSPLLSFSSSLLLFSPSLLSPLPSLFSAVGVAPETPPKFSKSSRIQSICVDPKQFHNTKTAVLARHQTPTLNETKVAEGWPKNGYVLQKSCN